MKDKLTVVKLGGNCMDNSVLLQNFLAQFSALPGKKILVHGGGKIATNISTKLGISTKMLDGRRVTDAETLDVITMVYAGLLNKNLVTQLQAMHCNATGLCGADGNLVRSVKRNPVPVDYGFVGDPVAINSGFLQILLEENFVPVISPVTHNGEGQLLNTNADTIASEVAVALTACFDVHLIFAFDKKGVLEDAGNENSVIPELKLVDFLSLKKSGQIHSGMLPKLNAGFSALERNTTRVAITHIEALCETEHATLLAL